MSALPADFFGEIDPPQRLLMGPGPANVHPRVLRAMSADVLGQFDPEMTAYMNQTMALYRRVFMTENRWTFLIDGTARAGIEAALASLIEPGARVLILRAGRFGMLLSEIAERLDADIRVIDVEWGQIATLGQIEAGLAAHRPAVFAAIHGDTSTTTAQPLDGVGALCARYGALSYIDATATLGGMPVRTDEWGVDVVSGGLQKCMGGPPGCAPITISDRAAAFIFSRRKVESGIRRDDLADGARPAIRSNYFDLSMIMEYWSEKRLNHHTEATSMLYAARECARVMLQEGLDARFARHEAAGRAMVEGLRAMGLTVYGQDAYRMTNVTGVHIPDGVDGERVRRRMREEHQIEIGSAFGPLAGKIWRIGAMGYNAEPDKVRRTLAALRDVLDGA
ncbi:pyridoxal-phosphate-dependent aminotransferase family protein [Acidomonas methanolica]|uniref:Serine--pyruvate aminotransferase n=2 Tax=Acidomonas methanolica TaxID=437 RepID=A0A023D2G9_ACIMT|nr:alanine--glyoxylate aminotransferase family protein [Acidomonas methanolica]MBU2654923.1 alanine--glyoxylate aminotransferase family protein [Acidomonas methanolica]TCS26274.1 (S)-ureidoglycine-glyoxylate aminotransferase [Acidomonas methanolica]GAJ28327.1 serine--pyruvate aminotransferase [Acidomonas methanolica NBRC 104435]GEK99195.1 aminotransferase V [Acidomonas methanolica NBRC 104435]